MLNRFIPHFSCCGSFHVLKIIANSQCRISCAWDIERRTIQIIAYLKNKLWRILFRGFIFAQLKKWFIFLNNIFFQFSIKSKCGVYFWLQSHSHSRCQLKQTVSIKIRFYSPLINEYYHSVNTYSAYLWSMNFTNWKVIAFSLQLNLFSSRFVQRNRFYLSS